MKFLSQINVNTEYTLPFVDGTNGQVLTTDGNGAVYWGSVSAGATNLNALTDVELTSPSTGQILRYEIPLGGSVPVWRNVTPGYLDPNSSINALGDVTITSAVAGQILQFNGTFWINTTLSTVEYVSKVQHTVKAGVAITKGQAVYVTTSDGTNMIVGLASNTSEATSSKVIGLAASNAAINDQIFVVTEGLLAGLNTSTATAGDPVWLGTNGNLIFGLLNKPASPAHLVYIGVVTRVQQNNGEIFVKVQNGIEIDEIHDVQISSPATGQLLRRDSDGYWKNWTPNFLTSFTETDPTVPSYVKSISTTDINNWNTGYNDSIRAIGFSTTTGVVTLTQQDGGTLTVDLDGRYLQSFTETDPVYTASTWYDTINNSRDWDDAYSWGDHSLAGYLTSYTETDTLATVTGRGNVTSTPIRVEAAATGLGGYISVGNSTEVAGNYSAYFFGNTAGDASYFKGGIAYETIASTYGRGNIHFLQNTSTSSGIVTLSDSVMTILNNGNVGIGTTSPAEKLHVSGSTRINGTIYSGDGSISANNSLQLVYSAASGIGTIAAKSTGGNTTLALQTADSGTTTDRLYIASNGNVGIGRTSPSYKIDVAGNARFDNELYVGGVWSTSYGPRTAGGNIHFHDWSGNVRARINTVAGVTSVGNRKLSLGILDINSQGTPEIKINTKIPFALGGADFTVNIKGFQYGSSNMVSLSIGWHYYLSQFYSETAISNGSFSPTITLGVEPEGDYAGCVVIHLSNVGYWPKLYVESVYSSAYADDYVANWSWSDVGIDGLTDISVVAYKPLETSITGSAGYATNAGNSTTTSQTNFTTLTLSNAAVATQAWVQTQGYLTSLPAHNHDDRYYTETESDARFYLATNPSGYITSSGNTSGYSGSLSADDNRTISPSEIGANQLKFGFTSWANNNSAPYADFLHLRSYGDHTGGSDNLIMFKKSGIGMRIWQQTFGSSTAYSSYADVWTTENFSSTDISNWNAAYNDKINTASFNTANGVLTLTQQDGGTVTVDLDGRYLTSDTDAQTLTWDAGSKTLGITNGNDVILSELATEDFVTSQGFVTSVANLAIQTIGGDSGAFNLDTVSGQHGFVRFSTGTWGGTNPYPGNYSHVLSMNQSTVNGNRTVQMYMGDVPGALFWRMNQGGTLHPWERIWTAANDGADSGLNADLLDGNHASAFALASHNHDDRYYTESESDSRFVNVSGDTMNGSLSFDAAAVIKKRITADGFNPVKTATGVLTAMSANSSGNTYYVIETNVPQDEYQMGGFTIEIFGNYYDKNSKTKVDLGGYWNPESNGGFEGFEAHGTNPQYKPTIEVARNNSTGKTAFIIYGVSWSYPIIVARDLWLGYNGTDGGTYGEGWTITGTNDVSSYTNKDTVVWRNAYSDSNPAGYITGYTETDTLASVTGRGASTSTAVSLSGGATISGITNNGNLVNNGKIVVQNYTNGTNARGIFMWADADSNWGIYMATSAAGASLSGGNSVASIDGRTSHHIRFRAYNATGNGFIWENDSEQCVMSLTTNTGNLYTRGSIYPSNQTTHYVDSTRIQNWQAAYSWGNHADAPYWNVSLNQNIQVESQQVTFAGDVVIQGTLTESSSIRFKENITPLEPALDKVNQLEAVSYNKVGVDDREIGLIAEDVAELFPEVVTYNEEGQPQGIQYQRLSVILLKAMQEQNAVIAALTERVNKLENK